MDIVGSLMVLMLMFSGVTFYLPDRIQIKEHHLEEQQNYNVKFPLDFTHRIELSNHVGAIDLSDARERVSDNITQQRRNTVQKMMKHAWDNYARYAWGQNELRPISKKGRNSGSSYSQSMGETIIVSLDTLYIMGMMDEFKKGRDWVEENLQVHNMTKDVSLYYATTRIVGSLLSCYALTGDAMFRDKAAQLTEKMLPAFETKTGIPFSLVNLGNGWVKNYGWASGGCSILAECGGLHLEFAYLSDITNSPVYKAKVDHIREVLNKMDKPNGLYSNYLHPKTGKWGQSIISMGAYGDSFYEYLLKAWIQSGKTDTEARQMYDEAIKNVMKHMLHVSKGGLTYISNMRFIRLEHKMEHITCFTGGLLGLGAGTQHDNNSDHYMDVAEKVTSTCHEAFQRSAAKLAPEAFYFTDSVEAKSLRSNEKCYILRPETIESYFVLWRLTKNPKYREWGWKAVQALEKECRVSGGYSGLWSVYVDNPAKDDVQQSFFLAETLKYLYLLFSDDGLVSLDEWVFNTNGHPLPIKGVNPYYRQFEV